NDGVLSIESRTTSNYKDNVVLEKLNTKLGRLNDYLFVKQYDESFCLRVGIITAAILGAFVVPYVLNTWLILFGKPEEISWWQGIVLMFVIPKPRVHIVLAALAVTWFGMKFV